MCPLSGQSDEKVMAFAEPLAVAIHAAHRPASYRASEYLFPVLGPLAADCQCCENTGGRGNCLCRCESRSLSLAKEMGADVLVNPQNATWITGKRKKAISMSALKCPSSFISEYLSGGHSCTRRNGAVGMGGAMAEFPMMTLIGKEIHSEALSVLPANLIPQCHGWEWRYQSTAFTEC